MGFINREENLQGKSIHFFVSIYFYFFLSTYGNSGGCKCSNPTTF